MEAALNPAHYLGSNVLSHNIMVTEHHIKLRDSISSSTVLRGKCCWKSINFITLTVAASLSLCLSPDPTEALASSEYFEGNYAYHFLYAECFTPSQHFGVY